jgi:hypothetical protein
MHETVAGQPLPRRWMYLRLTLLGIGALAGVGHARGIRELGALADSCWDLPLILVGTALVTLVPVAINAWNRRRWERPGWHSNPFRLGQPVLFFHLGAFYFIATGLGATAWAAVHLDKLAMISSAGFLCAGLGILGGVRLSLWLFGRQPPNSVSG